MPEGKQLVNKTDDLSRLQVQERLTKQIADAVQEVKVNLQELTVVRFYNHKEWPLWWYVQFVAIADKFCRSVGNDKSFQHD